MKLKHLKRLRVELRTVTPLFIGNGEKLTQKEYISGNGSCIVPDMNRLIVTLQAAGALEAFEHFVTELSAPNAKARSLREFLSSVGIPVSKDEDWVKYYIRGNSYNDLSCFIKNAEGQPYIPGSSVKGALRTALIAARMDERNAKLLIDAVERNPRNRYPLDEENVLRVLRCNDRRPADGVNDLLKTLQISDSAPFDRDALVACKKMDYQNGFNEISICRECVAPRRSTFFYITLDTSVPGALNERQLTAALNAWEQLQRAYFERFDTGYLDMGELSVGNGIPLTLGGGVGFQSKSLLYRAGELTGQDVTSNAHMALKNIFGKTYGANDLTLPAPYMLKLTQADDLYYPMGRCSLTLREE